MTDEAFERALEALSRKERTVGEMVAWLVERDFQPSQVAGVIERLIDAGALDDERFARRFAEDKRELRGWGPERIAEALAARGIDRAQIDAALAVDDRSAQLERAIDLLRGRGGDVRDELGRARALGYLARRGYDTEIAYDAVRGYERRRAA
jgi:regulatory protein